jgi:hypothetical protein
MQSRIAGGDVEQVQLLAQPDHRHGDGEDRHRVDRHRSIRCAECTRRVRMEREGENAGQQHRHARRGHVL